MFERKEEITPSNLIGEQTVLLNIMYLYKDLNLVQCQKEGSG